MTWRKKSHLGKPSRWRCTRAASCWLTLRWRFYKVCHKRLTNMLEKFWREFWVQQDGHYYSWIRSHGSGDPILIVFSHVARIRSDPWTCKNMIYSHIKSQISRIWFCHESGRIGYSRQLHGIEKAKVANDILDHMTLSSGTTEDERRWCGKRVLSFRLHPFQFKPFLLSFSRSTFSCFGKCI